MVSEKISIEVFPDKGAQTIYLMFFYMEFPTSPICLFSQYSDHAKQSVYVC